MPLTPSEERRLPVKAYEYVDVTFAAADTNYTIPYKLLKPSDPNEVRYLVVKRDRACSVYEDLTGTRVAWVRGSLTLKCSAANAQVRLLLFLES